MFLNLIDNAPYALDTLHELANALVDDANCAMIEHSGDTADDLFADLEEDEGC
jgi:hypothetical protein